MKGLKGDGHGGWYVVKRKFVVETVNGKLQFTGGGGAKAAQNQQLKVATPQAPQPNKGAPQMQRAAHNTSTCRRTKC